MKKSDKHQNRSGIHPSKPRGFSLFELVISIFIVALISGLTLANYRTGRRSAELKIAGQKVASDIRTMQNYSVSEKVEAASNMAPAGGWGVYFDMSQAGRYFFFADANSDHAYQLSELSQTMNLPANVVLDNIGGPVMTIVFSPPDPITYINQSSSTVATIRIKEITNNATSTISVNPFGLIEVLN